MAPTRYDPPGFMTDFDAIPNQLQQWSDAVVGWFDECVAVELSGPSYAQAIVWYCEWRVTRAPDGRTGRPAFEYAALPRPELAAVGTPHLPGPRPGAKQRVRWG
jgi:hypothetical protein